MKLFVSKFQKQHKAVGEYVRSKDASGSKHLLTIDHNNDHKMNLQLDLLDKVHFKWSVFVLFYPLLIIAHMR